MSELRVVLLGSTWKQRSAVGNLLLENDAFDLNTNCKSSLKIGGPLQEKKISVINTPDLLQADLTADRLAEFLKEIADNSAPGPHVFLLVLQPEDFTEQHQSRLQSVLESFSEQAYNHSLVLISTPRAETPGFMEKYMNDPNIKDIIRKCRYNYLWMNNTDNDANLKAFKREELLTRICQMLENSEEHLNYEQYEEAPSQQVYTEQTAVAKQKTLLSLPQRK
uniref:AIG1-type G domain-containing protein n=1 Tax=Neogobius melanostomus TaxID=47308 RepID=A0A8C6UZN4_9GOBI